MYTNYNVSSYGTGNSSYRTTYGGSYSKKSSALPSKPAVSLYSSTYCASYTQSTAPSKDVIRPRTRYHSEDMPASSRRTRDSDYTVPRSRTNYSQPKSFANERGREVSSRRRVDASAVHREYSLPRTRAISPATRRSNPVPEFCTIRSSNKPKIGRSASLDRSARTRNAVPSIEVKRSIFKNDEHVREMDSYSPSFYENGTSKKNRDHLDRGSVPSRSSTSSQRDDHYQNGYTTSDLLYCVMPTHGHERRFHSGETSRKIHPRRGSGSGARSQVSTSTRTSFTESRGPIPGISDSSSSGHDFNDPNAGLIGLKNIGNTEKYRHDINHKSPLKGKLIQAFSELVSQLWYPSKSTSAVSTSSFKSQIQKFSKRFSGYEQQDCQEFMRFLIEGLHEDVNKVTEKRSRTMPDFDSLCEESKAEKTWQFYLSKDNSFIVDLFMGQLKSSLECQECGHVSVTFDPFWDLSLPLPKNLYRSNESSVTVTYCLQNFTKEEILDRDERPTCDKCKCRRRMTKKFTIHKFPKILVIHLKRFSEGSYRQKLTVDVDFSHKLRISHPVSTSDASFHLYAVSNHIGSCYGGHYTAYCKHPETKRWHSFNDSSVSSMSESSVQSREAYVLFYEQLSSRSHL